MINSVGDRAGAVVVTYHPDQAVLENLAAVRPQMDALIVVDNGSTDAELAPLRASAAALDFILIENGDNLGIATAFNIGMRRAGELQCDWIFLFDQDSQVTEGFRASMIDRFQAISRERRLGILIPRYIDKRLGTPMKHILEPDGTIETAMSSGTLISIATCRDHGGMADHLFIDGVDHEFSLRLRALAYTIEECPEAVLLHSPGEPSSHRIPGRANPVCASNYSPIRRYYQERNKIWLARRFWRRFPYFTRRQFQVSAKDLLKIFLFEDNKLPKLRLFFLGMWHGLLGRSGRYPAR